MVTFPAAAIVLAYLGDAIGLTLHPLPILVLSLGAAAAAAGVLARSARNAEHAMKDDGQELLVFFGIVAFIAAWFLWLAWPSLLPVGSGSDLTHHLLLIDYIDRTGTLPQDRTLVPYFGEMFDYTPGTHLLAVLAGRWTRSEGLHAVFGVIALSVALKAAIVFLIALRCLPEAPSSARVPVALTAPLLLFLPNSYFLGSFVHDSYLAQVLAELFAVAAWWAIVCWDHQPSSVAAAMVGGAGVATFLTWPVWIGPIVVTFVTIAMARRDGVHRHLMIALLPIAVIALLHGVRHFSGTSIAGATGFALIPTPAVTGWIFPILGALGTLAAFRDRRARTVPVLLGAIALQAAALIVVARANRAEAPYLALKMFYLAIYPLAVAGAVGMAFVFRWDVARGFGQAVGARGFSQVAGARGFSRALPWLPAALLLIPFVRLVGTTARPSPVVSNDLRDAGRWARLHVPPACVDYLMADDDSAYWLHLVVLGNPRATKRSLAAETFEPQKALVRWILPGGLPYAIVENIDTLPRDIRTNVDVLARFGPAAVIKRRGESSCPGS